MARLSLLRARAERAAVDDTAGQALLARWRDGDPAAFADLFRHYRALVYGVLYNLMPRDPELEDVVQAAFVEVFRSLDRFEGRSRLGSWVARVALNVGYHHLRHKRSRPASYKTEPMTEEPVHEAGPHDALERAEIADHTRRILSTLAPKKRTVFILSELQGMDHAEIAEVVGVGVATVRTRLFYARREFWKKAKDDPVLAAFAEGSEKDEA